RRPLLRQVVPTLPLRVRQRHSIPLRHAADLLERPTAWLLSTTQVQLGEVLDSSRQRSPESPRSVDGWSPHTYRRHSSEPPHGVACWERGHPFASTNIVTLRVTTSLRACRRGRLWP